MSGTLLNLFHFQALVFFAGLLGRLDVFAIDKIVQTVADASIVWLTVVLRTAPFPNSGKSVLVHGAWHVTLIPECQPTLVICAPSVTSHCWVRTSWKVSFFPAFLSKKSL